MRADWDHRAREACRAPSQAIIENYIREVQRVLCPGSLFKFQVQGSSQVIACEGDTWIGAPISSPLAVELAERNGFETVSPLSLPEAGAAGC